MKNIPAVWCLEPVVNAGANLSYDVKEGGEYVVCLEGPGTVQVESSNQPRLVTLTEQNPCACLMLASSSKITISLFSSPGLQWVQVYKRVK